MCQVRLCVSRDGERERAREREREGDRDRERERESVRGRPSETGGGECVRMHVFGFVIGGTE